MRHSRRGECLVGVLCMVCMVAGPLLLALSIHHRHSLWVKVPWAIAGLLVAVTLLESYFTDFKKGRR